MGDCSTHLIQYSGYWHLVHADDYDANLWISQNNEIICRQGEESHKQRLKDIPHVAI